MTGGGFVRRGGLGLGRLIVSRGYGSDGRPDYEAVPLACFSTNTASPSDFDSGLPTASVLGRLYHSCDISSGIFNSAECTGAILGDAILRGAVECVAMTVDLCASAELSSAAVTIAMEARLSESPQVVCTPTTVGMEGDLLNSPHFTSTVLHCNRT